MGWKCSFTLDGLVYHPLRQKAERLGVPVSKVFAMAAIEYLDRHPREQEEDERKLYETPQT